jgi:hypothetical protein
MPKHLRFEPGGIGEYFDEFGTPTAQYASTCAHCQRITEFPSKRTMMEYVEICRGCMRLICIECHGKPCFPYDKRADQQETEYEIKQRLIKDGWRCY